MDRQHQAEDPDHQHGGAKDDRPRAILAFDPGPVFGRTRRRRMMVDVEARQQEQACHPEDDEGDVGRLYPRIGCSQETDELAHASPLTSAINSSTWAIGVSCWMPCPRLK